MHIACPAGARRLILGPVFERCLLPSTPHPKGANVSTGLPSLPDEVMPVNACLEAACADRVYWWE